MLRVASWGIVFVMLFVLFSSFGHDTCCRLLLLYVCCGSLFNVRFELAMICYKAVIIVQSLLCRLHWYGFLPLRAVALFCCLIFLCLAVFRRFGCYVILIWAVNIRFGIISCSVELFLGLFYKRQELVRVFSHVVLFYILFWLIAASEIVLSVSSHVFHMFSLY